MEALTALVAALLGRLHGVTADAVCPGGWPWAVSLLGVAVGLVPAAGAAAVALWRRRIGSRYGPAESVVLAGTGLLACGVRAAAGVPGHGPGVHRRGRQRAGAGADRPAAARPRLRGVRGRRAEQLPGPGQRRGGVHGGRSGAGRAGRAGAGRAAGGGGAVHGGVGAARPAPRAALARPLLLAAGPGGGGADDGRARGLGGAPVARRVGRGAARDAGGAVAGRTGVGGGAPVPRGPAAGRGRAVEAAVCAAVCAVARRLRPVRVGRGPERPELRRCPVRAGRHPQRPAERPRVRTGRAGSRNGSRRGSPPAPRSRS